MRNPPTGIIRTLPTFYADPKTAAGRAHRRALKRMEQETDEYLYIALSQQPRQEVLHVYLCIAGQINVRLNLAGYEDGDARECFDGSMRKPACWAICTGPISRPPEPIQRRGFQGIRYTEALWYYGKRCVPHHDEICPSHSCRSILRIAILSPPPRSPSSSVER